MAVLFPQMVVIAIRTKRSTCSMFKGFHAFTDYISVISSNDFNFRAICNDLVAVLYLKSKKRRNRVFEIILFLFTGPFVLLLLYS